MRCRPRWNVNAPGNYTYASAWKVLEPNGNGGTCADESWLMDDALGVIGIWSQVRYVYPRAANAYYKGKLIHDWTGLWSTKQGWSKRAAYEGQIKMPRTTWYTWTRMATRNTFEGCCFVNLPANQGGGQRYYEGGNDGYFATTAYGVWQDVTQNGAARWRDMLTAPNSVPGPNIEQYPPPDT